MLALAAHADAHAVVRRPELDHVDAGHRQDALEVLDGPFLFDHQHYDGFLVALDELLYAADGRAASIVAMGADAARNLRFDDANAIAGVGWRTHVREQHVLDASGHRADGDVRLCRALDLDEPGEVGRQLDGARQVVERVQVVGGVFGQELDVIEVLAATHDLGDRRPRALNAVPESGFVFAQQGAQSVLTHGGYLAYASTIRTGATASMTATLDLSATERAPATAGRIASAAQAFLGSLNEQQRRVANLPFGDDRRYVWDYRPLESTPRPGLRLINMNDEQKQRALALLDIGLSARGADTVRNIM